MEGYEWLEREDILGLSRLRLSRLSPVSASPPASSKSAGEAPDRLLNVGAPGTYFWLRRFWRDAAHSGGWHDESTNESEH